MQTFENRLKDAILTIQNRFKEKIEYSTVMEQIEKFKKEFECLLHDGFWVDTDLSLRVSEFDMLLTMYNSLYERTSKALQSRKLKIWQNDDRPYEIVAVYLLRFIIQDTISLRNFCATKFENQFNAVFRNIIEKINIFFLFMYDYDFSLKLSFNPEKIAEKKLYYDYLRPLKIKERIVKNLKEISEKEKENNISYFRFDKLVYNFLVNETINDAYGLSSNFVHTNNFYFIMRYYLEGNKFNYSLLHNSTNYFYARLDYAIEFILLLFFHIVNSLETRGLSSRDEPQIERIHFGYGSVLIKEKYKKAS